MDNHFSIHFPFCILRHRLPSRAKQSLLGFNNLYNETPRRILGGEFLLQSVSIKAIIPTKEVIP